MHETAGVLRSPVATDIASLTSTSTRGEAVPFTFTGTGFDYFGVWLLNLTLSVP